MQVERKFGNVILVARPGGSEGQPGEYIVDMNVVGSDASAQLTFGPAQLAEAALDLAEGHPWVVEHSGL